MDTISNLKTNSLRMPAVFVGHGSPMNAIENNNFTRTWEDIARSIPKPKAILSVSAHWVTNGSLVNDSAKPGMIYDMYGFPEELYKVVYEAPGAPELAHRTQSLITRGVSVDNQWGLDHGTWSVLCRMYPQADIPVFQLSIDSGANAAAHFDMGKELRSLRDEGVLILGSGNIVHNLARARWDMSDGFSWADEFDLFIRNEILSKNFDKVINYRLAGDSSDKAFVTTEHYMPLLYVLGAVFNEDNITVFNDERTMGSISMTGYLMM